MLETTVSVSEEQQHYRRFSSTQRYEHIILLVTFTGLAITGLPQRYADHSIGQFIINLLGGIESIRIVHRILATLLMAESIFHGGMISYKLYVLRQQATMMPGIRDARDAVQWILFNLGFRSEHPHLPRYNFGEKAEYLAVVWGTVVMIITGFMMWNPIASAKFVPGSAIPAARAAHSAEALLAVLAILIWHMYNVHIRTFNPSMFTGRLSQEAMEEEHAEELELIRQERLPQRPPDAVLVRRMLVFTPYAIAVTIILTATLVYFITFEDTAITTLPERQTAIATDIDLSKGILTEGIQLWVDQNCADCHGTSADGGSDPFGVPIPGDISPQEFIHDTRLGPADMPPYPITIVSDEEMAHLWKWFSSLQ